MSSEATLKGDEEPNADDMSLCYVATEREP